MAEETIPLTPLSDHDNEEEGSSPAEPSARPSNKQKKRSLGNIAKKVKTLDKTSKFKSWVWKWCDPVLLDNGNTGAECVVKITDEKVCGRLYLSGNSTSNLISHLAGSHQITENTKVEGRLVQSTITKNVRPHKESKQEQLRQSLTNWFIADSLPLKLTQSEMFRKFLYDLDPCFVVPDVKSLKLIIHKAYNHTLPLITQYIENHATSVNLTTDLWTARNRQGYIGVTCCFLDEEFQLHELVLTVTYVRYPHTADHIGDTLLEILDQWLLREKVNVITTDNAANMKKAICNMHDVSPNITWLGCTAHTLQLVVGKGLACVKPLVLRAKRLIDFFMRPKQSERLEKIQITIGNQVNPGKTSTYLRHCIADVNTRWNSSFLAWTRLLEIKPYIDILATTLPIASDTDSQKDGKRLVEIMLTKDEWDLLDNLCQVLKAFEEATTYLGASKYVTHSIMSPLLKEIRKRVKPENEQHVNVEEIVDVFEEEEEGEQAENTQNTTRRKLNLDVPFITKNMLEKVKNNLYNAMELYWNEGEEKIENLISALLDPRIKSLKFIDNEEIRDKAKDSLKNKYDQLKVSTTTVRQTPAFSAISLGPSSLFSIFEQNTSHDDEITVYFSLPDLDFNFDPFTWWRDHKEQFPILSKLARTYLPVPATSTPSERLFSSAGNLLTAKRTRLNPELFNRLIFLKKNASFVNNIHDSSSS